jgi:peptidoglycan-associated lipoprotein
MIRSIATASIRAVILTLALAGAGLMFSGCPKQATNIEPEEEPEPPRVNTEPATQAPAAEPAPVVREEASEAAPLVFGNVNFDYDRSELTPDARQVLANHATLLRDNPGVNLLVEGHCDERGTVEYNLALGERRADAVMRYLASLGIERSRFTTMSYGKERPLDFGHNETAWFKNRRAEFKIVNR